LKVVAVGYVDVRVARRIVAIHVPQPIVGTVVPVPKPYHDLPCKPISFDNSWGAMRSPNPSKLSSILDAAVGYEEVRVARRKVAIHEPKPIEGTVVPAPKPYHDPYPRIISREIVAIVRIVRSR